MQQVLNIGGVSAEKLAKTMGTPLIVYDEGAISKKLAEYKRHFRSDSLRTQVVYAGKAFLCKAMAELVSQAECGLDVVSGGELHCALDAGFPASSIVFHGNNKTPLELRQALQSHVGLIVMDNLDECKALIQISNELQTSAKVLLRVNPGVEAHTHKYIVTADIDSKFGISSTDIQTITEILNSVKNSRYLEFIGFHAHIGSQIFEKQAFVAEIEQLAQLSAEIEHAGFPVKAWDLGGGFAVHYTKSDAPIPLQELCETILTSCTEKKNSHNLSLEQVMIEPGRSIVGEAGTTLYTVGWQKQTPRRRYLFVDGGMADNIRPALYQAEYSCDNALKLTHEKSVNYTIAGKCCESGDILIENALLPPMASGDILAVYTTGAYCYSMASNYNHLGRPAVVFAKDGKARCVLHRESPQAMLALQCNEEVQL